jgi:hypothetical protein
MQAIETIHRENCAEKERLSNRLLEAASAFSLLGNELDLEATRRKCEAHRDAYIAHLKAYLAHLQEHNCHLMPARRGPGTL